MTKMYSVTFTQSEYSTVMESLENMLQKCKRRQQVSSGAQLDKWLDAEYAIDKLVIAMRAAKVGEMTDEFRKARLDAAQEYFVSGNKEVKND